MAFTTILALACMACTDDHPSLPRTGVERAITPVLQCNVHVQSGTMTCAEQGPSGTDGPSLAILGNASVKLRSANNSYDSVSLVYGFDVTVQNLLAYPIGTPDGQTRAGIKVFFEKTPYVTVYKAPGDTGTVTLLNTDGAQDFTAASQPYFFYDTILTSQQTTDARRWQMHMPRTVQNFGFSVRVFTTTTAESKVPLSAPNLRPSWFATPTNHIRYGNSRIRVLKNVVRVDFRPTATREERQAAVDVVGGTVVGGEGGLYYVRVPATGTLASLESYLLTLQRLPQVRQATVYIVSGALGLNYRRARDTVGWREWELDPDSADGANWALERIGAPYGWGCSCGDSVTTVAVVDMGFHAQPDLARNVDLTRSIGWNAYAGAADTIDHGTSVAAIMSARGNDTSQVTGTMWRSQLLLYDASTDSTGAVLPLGLDYNQMWRYVRRAARQGARVINLSMGIAWVDTAGNFRNPVTEPDTAQRRRDREVLAGARLDLDRSLDSLVAEGLDPLLVIAAGNDGLDARWGGWETTTHAGRLLQVGASTRADGLATFSNHGSLVEVAAPGESLTLLWGNGLIDSVRTLPSGNRFGGEGTSFASPHAAGVAGLLFSFDPRLTAADVKRMVIDGAVRGQRAAGGIPILNAHESLILAGRRAGAPICGNRLWVENQTFYVQRDTASPAGEPQFAVSHADPRSVAFEAMHGGKQVMLFTRPTTSRIGMQWTVTGWTTIPFSSAGPRNASFLSRAGQSHEADTTIVLENATSAPRTVSFRPTLRMGTASTPVAPAITDSAYENSRVCASAFLEVPPAEHESKTGSGSNDDLRAGYYDWLARRGSPGQCHGDGPPISSAESYQSIAYAPTGQQAYAFMVRRRGATHSTGSRTCTRTDQLVHNGMVVGVLFYTATCFSHTTVITSAGTSVYRIDIPAGTVHLMPWGEPTQELFGPMLREDGREMLVERSSYRHETRWAWQDNMNGVAEYVHTLDTTADCRLTFRDVLTGTIHLSPGICSSFGGQGGFGAVRAKPGS